VLIIVTDFTTKRFKRVKNSAKSIHKKGGCESTPISSSKLSLTSHVAVDKGGPPGGSLGAASGAGAVAA
jgi:hypothetical protein